ncbi:protease [Vibrio phage D148]
MKNMLMALMAVFALSGCAANGIPTPSLQSNAMTDGVEKIFVGIPVMASIEGSTARLDEEWFVTAAHNRLILDSTGHEVYYHPTCDIALVREKGISAEVAKVVENEEISVVGYPVNYPTITVNEGKHIGFVRIQAYRDCDAFEMSTATTMSGISGGGVYNKDHQLIGVIDGIIYQSLPIVGGDFDGQNVSNTSYFTNLYEVRGWLTEITGKEYF